MQDHPHITHHHSIRWLHWTTAIALVISFISVLCRDLTDDDTLRAILLNTHRWTGLSIFAITFVRLVQRHRVLASRLHQFSRLLAWASRLSHWGLYLGVLALPVLGLAVSNARGQRVLGLPLLVGRDRDLADVLADIHETAAWVLLALITLHVVAALWHHWHRRDAVMASMLPKLHKKKP